MIDISHLNPRQKKAVETTEGPLLVLAGAGSGKTSVLTHRIAFIIDSGLAGSENILAVTFTNKASGEMKERILKLLHNNPETKNIKNIFWMGTFHSIGVKILKAYGDKVGVNRNFTIYDSSDQRSVIKEAMQVLNISIKEFNPKTIGTYISSAKNQLVRPNDYEKYAQGYIQQIVSKVYPKYQEILKDNNALDFDDLIMRTVDLLEENKETREHLRSKFKYILVDEYQDTNIAQYHLVKMLTGVHQNICVVGDDDQSIYSFRGATIQNILNFESDYPKSNVIKLEQNYRSTKTILDASYQIISKNKDRKEKKLWTENIVGEKIMIYTARDEKDEGNWIAESIEQKENLLYSEVAVLYRTNAQSRALEESFISFGIPYKIVGGVRFYERKEIKDILGYLRSIFNQKDNKSVERIINVPRRGIGNKAVDELASISSRDKLSFLEMIFRYKNNYPNQRIIKFGELMDDLINASETKDITDLINFVIERTGYLEMLDDGTLENQYRIENLKELITVASKFSSLKPKEALERFLEEVSLLEGVSEQSDTQESVTLMTIHSAKGLEFKYVFVVGMEENLFPHSNTLFNDRELEEERRLAYVAITRAKEKLHLLHTKSRTYFGSIHKNPPSRFILDINEKLVDFRAADFGEISFESNQHTDNFNSNVTLERGDRVKHEYFGIGKVCYLDEEMVEVDFGAAYGVKELMLEYARLEKL